MATPIEKLIDLMKPSDLKDGFVVTLSEREDPLSRHVRLLPFPLLGPTITRILNGSSG